MNRYSEECFLAYEQTAKRKGNKIVEKHLGFLSIDMGPFGVSQHKWEEKWTLVLSERFQDHEFCALIYTCEQELTYLLKIRYETDEMSYHYDFNKELDKMELWTYQEHVDVSIPHVENIKQLFRQLVEELPEYRLRFVTGELQTKEV